MPHEEQVWFTLRVPPDRGGVGGALSSGVQVITLRVTGLLILRMGVVWRLAPTFLIPVLHLITHCMTSITLDVTVSR